MLAAGELQPAPDGKAIWRATVNSEAGWSHSFTLLRMSPALIWQPDERPAPFAGTVTVEATSETGTAEQPAGSSDEATGSIETCADNMALAAGQSPPTPASANTIHD